MLAAPIDETTTVGATVNDRGRVMAFVNITFDRLFGKKRGANEVTSEERK